MTAKTEQIGPGKTVTISGYIGCVKSADDECDCECHRFSGMKHCMPCCITCEYCGKNIRIECIDEHEKKCVEQKKTAE